MRLLFTGLALFLEAFPAAHGSLPPKPFKRSASSSTLYENSPRDDFEFMITAGASCVVKKGYLLS